MYICSFFASRGRHGDALPPSCPARGTVTWPMNNKISIGNYRRRRKILVGFTRIQVIIVWCPPPHPPPPGGDGGGPSSRGGGGADAQTAHQPAPAAPAAAVDRTQRPDAACEGKNG